MKNILLLFYALVTTTIGVSQSNTETVLRTLGLPPEYAFVDGYITDYKLSHSLVITKTVDKSKSVKNISATGKVTYSNAPDVWGYEVKESRDEMNNAGTYLPNFISMRLHSGANYLNPNDVYEIKKDRINPTSTGGWIGETSLRIESLNSSLILLTEHNEIGASQNVIPRTFVKRVGTRSYYKTPVDYLGRDIVGDTIYNEGAPASNMRVPYSGRVVSVTLITKTKSGSGLWSTSNPVWSGGVKTYTNTTSAYVPVSELYSLFGSTVEELEDDLRTEIYCSPLNAGTHITSTSTEIVVFGNEYSGTTYYSGADASIVRPSGKMTSYNKSYPGHLNRWLLKQSGSATTGARGEVLSIEFAWNEDTSITVIAGNKNSYDPTTQTLTYNSSLNSELWFQFEELPAQGKNWSGETIIQLE